jgi:hypothetical protein
MHRLHRQVLSLVYGVAVTAIAVLALNQGSSPTVIVSVVGMSMLTLMLIFGVEIDTIRVLDKVEIQFTDGSDHQTDSDAPVETDKTE